MQLARVVGQAVSTVKHPTLKGWRLLLVQPLTPHGTEDGEPLLAIDNLGAGTANRDRTTADRDVPESDGGGPAGLHARVPRPPQA